LPEGKNGGGNAPFTKTKTTNHMKKIKIILLFLVLGAMLGACCPEPKQMSTIRIVESEQVSVLEKGINNLGYYAVFKWYKESGNVKAMKFKISEDLYYSIEENQVLEMPVFKEKVVVYK
jgi:hypothetical protein